MNARLSAMRSAGTDRVYRRPPESRPELHGPIPVRQVPARVDVPPRVHPVGAAAPREAVPPHLGVGVGAGRVPARADVADDRSLVADPLALPRVRPTHVVVGGVQARAVIDDDPVAAAVTSPSG